MVTHLHSAAIQPIQTEDFLPPISRWTSLGGLVLMGTIAISVSLAAVVKYNVVVKATAVVRPAGDLQVVQSDLEGSIEQIAVQENQSVRQGDAIAYLDDAKLQIQKSQLLGSIQQNQTQLDQVATQIRFLEAQISAESNSTARAIVAAQAQTARDQRDLTEKQLTTQADVDEAQVSLEHARDEWNRYHSLAEAGAVSQLQLAEKESAMRIAQVRLERAQASLNPTDAAVRIAQEDVVQQQARGEATLANLRKEREALAQRRSEIQSQLIRDQKELEQIDRDLQRSIVRATTDGTIFQLNISNSSQVVRPGDNIAQIVPANTPLIVRANVANQDIDRVQIGQTAQLRVDACPYSDYGVLKGTVQTIAPDAGTVNSTSLTATGTAQPNSNQSNQDRAFVVTIALENSVLTSGQQQCEIQPGMQASASIISREETFLQFVLRRMRVLSNL